MLPTRLLRAPLARLFGATSAKSTAPILPFSARQAVRARSPPLTGRSSRSYPLTGGSRRAYSTSPPPSPTSTSPEAVPTSLTGRLKHLIRTHGWYALGMYSALSLLDYSLTFASIYLLGADQVSLVTARMKDSMTNTIGWPAPSQTNGAHDIDEGTVAVGNTDSVYAIALLAYGIHKTLLLPVRVGLTAALTPRFVAFLTRRGWVGKGGVTRAAQHMQDKVKSRSATKA